MKTNKAIGAAILVAVVAGVAYGLGYQHGGTSSRVALNNATKLRQVGLSFRGYRNDLGRFNITGEVAAPMAPPTKFTP